MNVIRLWLSHLKTVEESRKRGATKPAATRRIRAEQEGRQVEARHRKQKKRWHQLEYWWRNSEHNYTHSRRTLAAVQFAMNAISMRRVNYLNLMFSLLLLVSVRSTVTSMTMYVFRLTQYWLDSLKKVIQSMYTHDFWESSISTTEWAYFRDTTVPPVPCIHTCLAAYN